MKHSKTSKLVAVVLCAIMLLGILPMAVFAAVDYTHDSAPSSDHYYKLVSKKDWDIAPGIEESEIVLNNTLGTNRQVCHVMVADLTNEYVKVTTSYANMDTSTFNVANMYDQAVAAQEKYGWNVVGAMNTCLSWYNNYPASHFNEPLGFMMIDGEVLWDNSEAYQLTGFSTCIVINKDEKEGVARPAEIAKVEMRKVASRDDLTGWEEQVIPCTNGYIVKNGVNQYSAAHGGDTAPRSVVGVTADGKVVIMENDGRQAISVGMNMYECAEMMINLGCVYAGNCDGGGSSTFVSKRPGADLAIVNSPSDGTPRVTTNGILFSSTAPSDGTFAKAHISVDADYYTPGSTVTFNAIGTDIIGTAVDIPDDAVWQIKEEGMGSIENGVFISEGKTGTVTAQLVYNGKVVGEKSINIVIPEIAFTAQNFMVKYGTSANITLVATTNEGVNEVVLKPSDYTITNSNAEIGSIVGNVFTAVSEENAPDNKEGTLTVTLTHGTGITATAKVKICKEITETLFDYENPSFNTTTKKYGGWCAAEIHGDGTYANYGKNYTLSPATAENGKVHNGTSSMRLDIDQLSANVFNGSKDYFQLCVYPEESIILNDVQSYGVWVYIDDEMYSYEFNFRYWIDSNNDGKFDTIKSVSPVASLDVYNNMDESGWYYLEIPVGGKTILLPGADIVSRTDVTGNHRLNYETRFIHLLGYPHTSNDILTTGTVNGRYTIYFDNFTVDYAADVADRTNPEFSTVTLAGLTEIEDKVMTKRNPVTTDDNTITVIANVSDAGDGLNPATAKAYVDGQTVDCTYSNGKISITDIAVANGMHRVKFEIADRAGNKSVVVRLVNVVSGVEASTIIVEPKDATLDKILCGSVYWMNLKATDIETIQSISATIDINSSNHWELDHMELAPGFTATYTVNEETRTADITITRSGKNTQTGEAVLASLPIRIVSFKDDIQYWGHNEATYWTDGGTTHFWAQDLKVDVDAGKITYVDGYSANTIGTFSNEEFAVSTEMYLPYNNIATTQYYADHGSLHVHTEQPMEDKEATAWTEGYTDRTYCAVCNSVVDWGTTYPATGHEHTYEIIEGRFVCTGCEETYGEIGLIEMSGSWYYAMPSGELAIGWIEIDDEWYYFDAETFEGLNGTFDAKTLISTTDSFTYDFVNGKLINPQWVERAGGVRYYYGPAFYKGSTTVGTAFQTIDGKEYCFDLNGYRLVGIQYIGMLTLGGVGNYYRWYFFDENGVSQGLYTGYATDTKGRDWYVIDGVTTGEAEPDGNGGLKLKNGLYDDYLYVDGVKQVGPKAVKCGDKYYYVTNTNKIARSHLIWNFSAKLLEGTGLKPGFYDVDENGFMTATNGVYDGDLYVNGDRKFGTKAYECDGKFYYVYSNNKIATSHDTWFFSAKLLEGTGLTPAYYDVDENGIMTISNGVYDGDLYVNGERKLGTKAYECDGKFYYVYSNNKIATSHDTWYFSAALLEGTGLTPAYYDVDENGIMTISNGVYDGDLYVNGERKLGTKAYECDGKFYYVYSNNKIATSRSNWYFSAALLEGTGLTPGYYDIDETGVMTRR